MNTARKVVRKIIYSDDYNPIREYWEAIKYKPLFAEIEKIEDEIAEAERKENVSSAFWYAEKRNWKRKSKTGRTGSKWSCQFQLESVPNVPGDYPLSGRSAK